jgi:hypothetical protein
VDILVNIFFLFSIYMSRRDGSYIRYLWQWNVFHLSRIATSALVLYSVIKVSLRDLIIGAVLNGAVLGCLLYAVSIAKFAYNNCERNLCRFSDSCVACEHQNYHDYDLTSKWSRKFSLFTALNRFTLNSLQSSRHSNSSSSSFMLFCRLGRNPDKALSPHETLKSFNDNLMNHSAIAI